MADAIHHHHHPPPPTTTYHHHPRTTWIPWRSPWDTCMSWTILKICSTLLKMHQEIIEKLSVAGSPLAARRGERGAPMATTSHHQPPPTTTRHHPPPPPPPRIHHHAPPTTTQHPPQATTTHHPPPPTTTQYHVGIFTKSVDFHNVPSRHGGTTQVEILYVLGAQWQEVSDFSELSQYFFTSQNA